MFGFERSIITVPARSIPAPAFADHHRLDCADRQAFPDLTVAQIVDLLFTTADDLGAPGDQFSARAGSTERAFQPVGTASLAGTGTVVTSAAASGGLPEAPAMAAPRDPWGRSSSTVTAARSHRPRQGPASSSSSPARTRATGHVRGSAVQAGPVSIAMSVAERPRSAGIIDVSRLGIGPDDARQSRLVAGTAIARLDSKTRAAFGFSEGAKTIERQLTDAEGGAFLIARDISGDPGFQARRGSSLAICRDLVSPA